jgi:group I intron endonuclease
MSYFLYELRDPNTSETRYIGITNNCRKRLNFHVWEASSHYSDTYKSRWIRKLLDAGQKPEMVVIAETMHPKMCKKLEVSTIRFYKEKGVRLTNGTIGGDGANGYVHTDEIKKKLSEIRSGEKHPLYGKEVSQEVCKKISESNLGKKQPWAGIKRTKEQRLAFSQRITGSGNPMYGKKFSAESIEKRTKSRKLSNIFERFYCA